MFKFLLGLIPTLIFSQLSLAQEEPHLWNMKFSNSNLCSRQSQEAAKQVYFLLDGFKISRLSYKLAQQAGEEPSAVVTEAVTEFQRANLKLTELLLGRLASGALPLLTDLELKTLKQRCGTSGMCQNSREILEGHFRQSELTSTTDIPKANIGCVLIKKNLPLQFRTSAPTKDELEGLALAYLDSGKYVERCDSLMHRNATDFNLMLKFDLSKPQTAELNDWQSNGFRFWDTFRAYMSWGWRYSNIIDSVTPQFRNTIKSLSPEEELLLIPEGCGGLTRPECSSDFLSANDLRNFASGTSFKGASKLTTYSLVSDLVKLREDKAYLNEAEEQKSAKNVENSELLSGIMQARTQASNSLYQSLLFLTAITNQKSSADLIGDIEKQIEDPRTKAQSLSDLSLLCAERRGVGDAKISGLAKELQTQKSLFENLDYKTFPGLTPSAAATLSQTYFAPLKSLCDKYSDPFARDDLNVVTVKEFKPWFQNFLSSLKFSDYSFENATPQKQGSSGYVSLKSKPLCGDSIDCARLLIESYVNLYSLSFYSKPLLSGAINSISVSQSSAGAVTCQIYNPWAFEQLRKKRLVSDVISALISGALYLPFYLKIDYQIPKVASFNELVKNGNVQYDANLISTKTLKTLVLDLGPWAAAPCSVVVSENPHLSVSQAVYAFHGVSAGVCKQGGTNDAVGDAFGVRKADTVGSSVCGACQISFEKVAIGLVASNFNTFRFGVRFLDATYDYFRSANSSEMPYALEVNPKYVAETYTKYESIPDECVFELAHNAKCMKDLCVSSAVARYEESTGNHVAEAYIAETEYSKGKYVWMKPDACDGEVGVPVVCSPNSVPSYVNLRAAIKTKSCRNLK